MAYKGIINWRRIIFTFLQSTNSDSLLHTTGRVNLGHDIRTCRLHTILWLFFGRNGWRFDRQRIIMQLFQLNSSTRVTKPSQLWLSRHTTCRIVNEATRKTQFYILKIQVQNLMPINYTGVLKGLLMKCFLKKNKTNWCNYKRIVSTPPTTACSDDHKRNVQTIFLNT